jgi:hypothetical protein
MNRGFVSLVFTFLLVNVQGQIGNCSNSATKSYLHVSHTLTETNAAMDSLAENINYCNFDMLLLGGDLSWSTSQNANTLDRVDSIFYLSDTNTLWSFGNHDVMDVPAALNRTGRNSHYAYYKNGITFIVLDTQQDFCDIIGTQKALVEQVADTIQTSSHLILLHHKLIWMNDDGYLQSEIDSVSNGPMGTWNCSFCIQPNNFYSEIYPILQGVMKKDVEVICLAGDLGSKRKYFSHHTEDGIWFLASGALANNPNQGGILFTHNSQTEELYWEFVEFSQLSGAPSLKSHGLLLYPNPAKGVCFFKSEKEVISLRVLDSKGNAVLVDPSCTNYINTRSIKNGNYLVEFKLIDGSFSVEKMMINH